MGNEMTSSYPAVKTRSSCADPADCIVQLPFVLTCKFPTGALTGLATCSAAIPFGCKLCAGNRLSVAWVQVHFEGREPPAVALSLDSIESCLVQLVSQSSLVERSAENRVFWTAPWPVPWTVPYSLLDLQIVGAPHYVATSSTRQAKNVFEDRLEKS